MSRRLRAWVLTVLVVFALLVMVGAPSRAAAPSTAGQLYAFGWNKYGELGVATNNGTDKANPTPTLVTLPGASGPVTEVAAGLYHSLAVTSTGQLYAFGNNNLGQLGIPTNSGTRMPNPTPTLVTLPGESGPVTQIAAGELFSLAVTSTGQLYAFGYNNYGQLGNATNFDTMNANPTPTLVTLPGESGPVIQIAAGGWDFTQYSLAVTSTGQLYSFGNNEFGQLGIPTNNGIAVGVNGEMFTANPTPTLVTLPGASGPVTQVAAGSEHSLAVTSTGQLYSFGDNSYGQLGVATNSGTATPNPTPMLVTLPGASGPVTQIAAGDSHSFVVTSTGQLYAFGSNQYGQLGIATNNRTHNANPTPTLVTLPGASGPVTQVAAGEVHSLVVTSTGQLYAFGYNVYGQLGVATYSGTGTPNPTPVLVKLPAGTTIDTVARGNSSEHALVVTASPRAIALPTAAQLKASLLVQLAPNGQTKLAALLKTKGYAVSFNALSGGVVVIDWYYLPSSKAKPVLVAAGKRTFLAAGTQSITVKLTAKGKQLLKKAKRIRLTAKGTFTAPGQPAVSATTSFRLTR